MVRVVAHAPSPSVPSLTVDSSVEGNEGRASCTRCISGNERFARSSEALIERRRSLAKLEDAS